MIRRLTFGVARRLVRIARRLLRPVRRYLRRGRNAVRALVRPGPHAAQLRRMRTQYSHGAFPTTTLFGSPGLDQQPIVMALWSRSSEASRFLAELSAQVDVPGLRVMLWNNAPQHDQIYLDAVGSLDPGAIASVEFVSSPANVGGLARFFLVARLRAEGYDGPIIMLDDDQLIEPGFVVGLRARYRPHSIAGVWAFRQLGSYWAREFLNEGEPASYVGTGGCIVDSAIVELPGFWRKLPARYAFIEDQWMSFCARVAGWTLSKADLPVEFVSQELNQHHAMVDLKSEFFRALYDARPDLEPR